MSTMEDTIEFGGNLQDYASCIVKWRDVGTIELQGWDPYIGFRLQ